MKQYTIATLGSHSALDICRGAKDEGFKTLVVCEKGREKTYAHYYKTAGTVGCVDDVIVVDKFKDVITPETQQKLQAKNALFVPHRSFEVYVNDYDAIEQHFAVPIFGNKFLLRAEERTEKINQYTILEQAQIHHPQFYKDPKTIDRLVIVKAQQKKVTFERGFFFATNYQEFLDESQKRIDSGLISEQSLREAVIEEFVVGTPINFNFFYSPLHDRLELTGTDTRRQTNLDGFLRLPATQQQAVSQYLEVTFKEMGHIAATLPESLLEEAFAVGERFVTASRKLFPPGIIGPFALQSLIRPVFPKLEIVVYDVAPRVPGSPGIAATPYSSYLFGQTMQMGRRVAREIKEAITTKQLQKIIT
jgi:5-formaminoimidazole-4-carboxamide-1-(beta)-D-ribofuranosyl 5'-monophosphate synthetase